MPATAIRREQMRQAAMRLDSTLHRLAASRAEGARADDAGRYGQATRLAEKRDGLLDAIAEQAATLLADLRALGVIADTRPPVADHEFKPYVDFPDLCVAELDNGDTCNRPAEEHAVQS